MAIKKRLRYALASAIVCLILAILLNLLLISMKKHRAVPTPLSHISHLLELLTIFYSGIAIVWGTCLFNLKQVKQSKLKPYEETRYEAASFMSFVVGVLLVSPIIYFVIPFGLRGLFIRLFI